MAATLLTIERLQEAINANEVILTANDRLRRHLLKAWGEHQRQRGLKAWRTPRIQPLTHWLDGHWQGLVNRGHPHCHRALANRYQRQWLWEQIIGQSDEAQALLQAEPLARQADAALRSLALWEVDPASLEDDPFLNSNSRSFVRWWRQFEQRLASRQLMTPEAGQQIIARAFEAGTLVPVPRLWLLGFDDIPPLHRRILGAAAREQIAVATAGAPDNRILRVTAADPEAELRAAALWSLRQLQAAPEAVIGVIVPDLGQRRDQVERIFSEVFEPASPLPDRPRHTPPFNFSAGVPLGNTPLVQAALGLLGLIRDPWPLEDLCSLVYSPFWSDPEAETLLRARVVARLRALGKFVLTGSDLRFHAQAAADEQPPGSAPGELPALQRRLQRFEEQRRRLPARATARHWGQQFQQLLELLGWPGPRRLDSQEFQQMGLWYELLENFASLEATGAELSPVQALQQLRQLASQTPFQAQTPDSPIQILGALEGAGLRFSHCWVLGLHQRQWPPVPAPNPLLPLDLQRDKHMPHASAERELHFARSLTGHYRQCAAQVVLSAPQGDDQGELAPSPLIADLPETSLESLLPGAVNARQAHEQALLASRRLEPVDCARGPAFPSGTRAPGGSSLFKHQAACPFNAFAQLRLGAQRPDPPVLGLSAAERGTLLHGVLASLWQTLGDSATLLNYPPEALETLIADTCEQTLQPIRQRRPRELGPVYCALELERLQAIVRRWLTLEASRPAFRVEATEQRRQIDFCGLQLTLFIDRIDLLDSGERLLIDYKTSADLSAGQWRGERPREPQLPLYAITSPEPVQGIAFAQLNPRALQWIGLGDAELQLPGLEPAVDWPAQQHEWREVLEQLALGFLGGDARVDFRDAQAQRYSEHLVPLNRILEAGNLNRFMASIDSGGEHHSP